MTTELPDVIPPLELAFRVTQLGGWDKVQVLSPRGRGQEPEWLEVNKQFIARYLNPEDSTNMPPSLWYVYDVRRILDAT